MKERKGTNIIKQDRVNVGTLLASWFMKASVSPFKTNSPK